MILKLLLNTKDDEFFVQNKNHILNNQMEVDKLCFLRIQLEN